jgi:undecaprenyl-phosphate galactose phosphotransferase
MVKYKNTFLILSLILTDLLVFFASFTAAIYVRILISIAYPRLPQFNPNIGMLVDKVWWMPFILIFFINYEGLYVRRLPYWEETKDIIKAVMLFGIFSYAIVSIAKLSDSVSRLVIGITALFLFFAIPFIRLWAKRFLYRLGLWKENTIIIGTSEIAVLAAEGLGKEDYLGYNVIGFLDDDIEKASKEISIGSRKYKIFGSVKYLKKFIGTMHISTVIIAQPSFSKEKLAELVATIQKNAKNIIIIPDLRGMPLFNSEINYLIANHLILLNTKNNLKSALNIIVKRVFDITVSVMLFPFILLAVTVLSILIKIDSKGPVFYSHKRVGKNGKTIDVYKFRSMHKDADDRLKRILKNDEDAKKEWGTYFKLKNDPRITKAGNFLRKTSLDELPQIFNVFKGDMSLVGPRPVLKKEIDEYYRENSQYYLMVKPGITGLWQVSGRNDTSYDFRVKLDTWYVLNWSLWLDVIILFKTVKVVIKKEGSY